MFTSPQNDLPERFQDHQFSPERSLRIEGYYGKKCSDVVMHRDLPPIINYAKIEKQQSRTFV